MLFLQVHIANFYFKTMLLYNQIKTKRGKNIGPKVPVLFKSRLHPLQQLNY